MVQKLDLFRSIYGEKSISQPVIVHLFLLSLFESEFLFHRQVRHCGYSLDREKKPVQIPKKQQSSTLSPFTDWDKLSKVEGWKPPSGANLSEEEKIRYGVNVRWYDTYTPTPAKEWRCPACHFHALNVYNGWESTHNML